MTERAKLEAQEGRLALFAACGWLCQVCGRPLREGVPQLAHRIPKRKDRIAKYGPEVIHHRLNLVPVCGLKCNGKVDLSNRPLEEAELVKEILNAL